MNNLSSGMTPYQIAQHVSKAMSYLSTRLGSIKNDKEYVEFSMGNGSSRYRAEIKVSESYFYIELLYKPLGTHRKKDEIFIADIQIPRR